MHVYCLQLFISRKAPSSSQWFINLLSFTPSAAIQQAQLACRLTQFKSCCLGRPQMMGFTVVALLLTLCRHQARLVLQHQSRLMQVASCWLACRAAQVPRRRSKQTRRRSQQAAQAGRFCCSSCSGCSSRPLLRRRRRQPARLCWATFRRQSLRSRPLLPLPPRLRRRLWRRPQGLHPVARCWRACSRWALHLRPRVSSCWRACRQPGPTRRICRSSRSSHRRCRRAPCGLWGRARCC